MMGGPPPGGGPPKLVQVFDEFIRNMMGMKKDERKKLDEIDKELIAKLNKALTAEQLKILAEPIDFDFSKFPPPGEFLSAYKRNKLKLTDAADQRDAGSPKRARFQAGKSLDRRPEAGNRRAKGSPIRRRATRRRRTKWPWTARPWWWTGRPRWTSWPRWARWPWRPSLRWSGRTSGRRTRPRRPSAHGQHPLPRRPLPTRLPRLQRQDPRTRQNPRRNPTGTRQAEAQQRSRFPQAENGRRVEVNKREPQTRLRRLIDGNVSGKTTPVGVTEISRGSRPKGRHPRKRDKQTDTTPDGVAEKRHPRAMRPLPGSRGMLATISGGVGLPAETAG